MRSNPSLRRRHIHIPSHRFVKFKTNKKYETNVRHGRKREKKLIFAKIFINFVSQTKVTYVPVFHMRIHKQKKK